MTMAILMKIIKIAGLLLAAVLLSACGGLIGAYLGGNGWLNLKLFGVRGYEAAGLVGGILGLFGGLALIWKFTSEPPDQ